MDYIDFVILWVDGSDSEWLEEKKKYETSDNAKVNLSNSINRFRDWDNLKYWFRGVEKYAPWVRKVHFVTYGHVPSFLNIDNPKLNIVNHKDIMPQDCLPCFNSAAIEININNISDLSEHFVYFNDDMFIIKPIDETDFFKNGLPCLEGLQATITSFGDANAFYHHILNDIDVINKHFDKRTQIKRHPLKWFNLKYGVEVFRNFFLMPWKRYVGLKNSHLPSPFLKSTFDLVWENEYSRLDDTRHNRFRSYYDLNQYVFRYWQLASGEFEPYKPNGYFNIIHDDNLRTLCRIIENQKYKLLCLNDSIPDIDFETCKNAINRSFEYILPEKSSFEL